MRAFCTERPDKSLIGCLGKLNANREGSSGWIIVQIFELLKIFDSLREPSVDIPCLPILNFLRK